jgi:hypothetical protein
LQVSLPGTQNKPCNDCCGKQRGKLTQSLANAPAVLVQAIKLCQKASLPIDCQQCLNCSYKLTSYCSIDSRCLIKSQTCHSRDSAPYTKRTNRVHFVRFTYSEEKLVLRRECVRFALSLSEFVSHPIAVTVPPEILIRK